jgi:hypothetical protein
MMWIQTPKKMPDSAARGGNDDSIGAQQPAIAGQQRAPILKTHLNYGRNTK